MTRGVGDDEGFVFTHEGFFDGGGSLGGRSATSPGGYSSDGDIRDEMSYVDPYFAYMKLSPHHMSQLARAAVGSPGSPSPSTASSIGSFSPSKFKGSLSASGNRSPAPRLAPLGKARATTSHEMVRVGSSESITSDITFGGTAGVYSPINSAAMKTRPVKKANKSSSSSSGMVSSLIGDNPWAAKLEQQKKQYDHASTR